MFRFQQAPAAAVEREYGNRFTGNRLHAVEYPRDEMVFSLIAVVNIAIVMIIRGTEAEDQADPAFVLFCQGFVFKKITDPISGSLDGKTAVFIDGIGTQQTVAWTDEMIRIGIDLKIISLAQEKVPIRPELVCLFPGQGNFMTTCISNHIGLRQGGPQKCNDHPVKPESLYELQHDPTGEGGIHEPNHRVVLVHILIPVDNTNSRPHTPRTMMPILPGRPGFLI